METRTDRNTVSWKFWGRGRGRERTAEVEGLERVSKKRDGSRVGCMVEKTGESQSIREIVLMIRREVSSRASSSRSLRERTTSCSAVSLSPTGEVHEQASVRRKKTQVSERE